LVGSAGRTGNRHKQDLSQWNGIRLLR